HVLAPYAQRQLELLPEPDRGAVHRGGELDLAGGRRAREQQHRGEKDAGSAARGPRAASSAAGSTRIAPRGAGHQSLPPGCGACCGGLGWFFWFCRSLLCSACIMRSACSLLIAPFCCCPCSACACCGCCCCGCGCCCGFCCWCCFWLESGFCCS